MLCLCKTQVKLKLKCVFPFVVGGNYNRAAKRGADSLQPQTLYRGIHHIFCHKSPESATNSNFGWVCWKFLALLILVQPLVCAHRELGLCVIH